MSEGYVTGLLARAPAATRGTRAPPGGLPWMSGYGNLNSVFVEAVALDEKLAVLRRPQDSTGFEIRLSPHMLPETLITAAPGRPFKEYVSHPLLDRFELAIDTVRAHQKSLRMKLHGGMSLWRRVRLKGGNEERRELKEEIRALRDGRRHIEKVIAGHRTLPRRRGDVEVPWDDILFDDGIDDFIGEPWAAPPVDEFEGISSQRRREERQHDDGDPIILFDEEDPESYEYGLRPTPLHPTTDSHLDCRATLILTVGLHRLLRQTVQIPLAIEVASTDGSTPARAAAFKRN